MCCFRVRILHVLYMALVFTSVRAGDIMNGYDGVLLQ